MNQLAQQSDNLSEDLRGNLRREAFVAAHAAVLYSLPFLIRLNNLGIRDWELFTAMAEVPRTLIFQFGQFPFWNPYIGGGNILFHHPEVAVFSPLYIFPLIFGAVIGLKLQILVAYFLGFWGTVRFSRALGISEGGSYLVSAVYFGSVFFALHFAEGHIPFTHFCFLPWVGYFWLRSLTDRKYILFGGIALGLMILGNGAAAPTLYTATFLGLLSALISIQRKNFQPLKSLALIGVIGAGLSAIKFVPMLVYLAENPWVGESAELVPLSALPSAFFSLDQGLFSHTDLNLPRGWHEYGAFLSPVAILLALWYRIRKIWVSAIWAIVVLFFLLLGLGAFADWSPWALLAKLPGYSSARGPGRAFQFVLLGFGIMAGFGFDNFRAWLAERDLSQKTMRWSIAIIFVFTAGLNYWLSLDSLTKSFTRAPIETNWSEKFTQGLGGKLEMYSGVRENRGTLAASRLSAYKENRGLLLADGTIAPEYVLSGSAQVLSSSYRGNIIEYKIQASAAGELVLGMGFDRGWKVVSPVGAGLRADEDLLTVSYPAGVSEIKLVFRPPYFWTGAFISLWSLFAVIYFNRRFSAI